MHIDPKTQETLSNYKLLIGSVLPRPIAFVTSLSETETLNAAPFSFFTVVATNPPMISVTVSRKAQGVQKDTARNIAYNKEFVVHVVDEENVERVNLSATDFPPEVSEVEKIGFTVEKSVKVSVPHLVQPKVKMECKLHQMLPMGGSEGVPSADLIIGEVVLFHVDDALYEKGRIDTQGLRPVGRLAGTTYGKLGEVFSRPRLTLEEWIAKYES